jgi:hypothetical protein
MGDADAAIILRQIREKFESNSPLWPEHADTTDSEISDLWEDLWLWELSLAGMITKVLDKRKPPILRWRGRPTKLRNKIEDARQRKPEWSDLLGGLLPICDKLDELTDLVERLRATRRG